MADYPLAQWFDAPRPCRICGKPAGALMSSRNDVLAYMCEAHAKKEIKSAHTAGKFLPVAAYSDEAAS